MSKGSLGAQGERFAAAHLERTGWKVLDRNVRVGRKEIDLVAVRGGVVAFAEVKTRRSSSFGHPLDAITPGKRRAIATVAQAWIERFGSRDLTYRFDALVVTRDPERGFAVEHVEDAWSVGS